MIVLFLRALARRNNTNLLRVLAGSGGLPD
jgi:hypothetical protein